MAEEDRHGIGYATTHNHSMVAMIVREMISTIKTVTLTRVQVRIIKILVVEVVSGIDHRVGHKSREDEPFPLFQNDDRLTTKE